MLTWQAHSGAVTSLAFVPGGGLLSAGTDGALKHWDAASGSLHYSWKLAEAAATRDEGNLLRVLADASGHYTAAVLKSEGVRFLDLGDTRQVEHFRVGEVLGAALAPDGKSVFVSGRGSPSDSRHAARLTQYSFPPGGLLAVSRNEARSGDIAVSPDTSEILVGRDRFLWPSGESGSPMIWYLGGRPCLVSHDKDKLFGFGGNRLVVWGFQVGVMRQKLKGHVAPIAGLTTTPDGRKLWTASADATVRQWDVESYHCEKCYGLKVGPLGCVAVSPDGLTAAAGSAHNGHIAVWDLD